jgi:hypothetical protein
MADDYVTDTHRVSDVLTIPVAHVVRSAVIVPLVALVRLVLSFFTPRVLLRSSLLFRKRLP